MAPMRARHLPLLFACLAFAPSGRCLAANSPQGSTTTSRESNQTHVLGFAAGDHFDQAETLTRALKKTIELSTNQKLGSGDFSLEVLTAALGCPEKPDHACLKKIAAKTSSQRFLWGTIEIAGQRIEAELHLYAEDASDKKVKFSYQASVTDPMDGALLTVAANAVSQLIGQLRYRVVVQSSEQSGVVFIDGKEAGTLVNGETTLDVPVGDHQFRLKAAGSSDKAAPIQTLAEQNAKAQIAELTRVRLDPTEVAQTGAKGAPTEVVPEDNPSEQTQKQKVDSNTGPAEKPRASNAQRTWGYITLGAGGVLLAGGALAALDLYVLNHKDNFERYRSGLSPSEDACTEADREHVVPGAMTPAGVRSLCRNASLLEITEIVLLASGAVAAGTGLTLLLTSKSSTSTATRTIEPRIIIGRDRSDFGVVVRY